MRAPLLALALLAAGLAGCTGPGGAPPPAAPPAPGPTPPPTPGFNPIAKFGTDLGDVYVEVFEDMVPLTAANFLGYVRSGFYEGIKVHRIVGPSRVPPDGFMIQMGDPNTRDPTKGPETWGRGDPNLPRIPDELHPALRHDAPGILSMANAGPNTGTSQFFITLAPTPSLDDKHAVFGKVVAGMNVVKAIGNARVSGETPVEEIVIRETEVLEKRRDPAQVTRGLEAWTYTPVVNTTKNHTVQFAAFVRNTGNVREPVAARLEVPQGWNWSRVWPADENVSAGGSQGVMFRLTSPTEHAIGGPAVPVKAVFEASGERAEVPFQVKVGTLGRTALGGTRVQVHYIGTVPDGRLFDASLFSVASNASAPKYAPAFELRPSNQYGPLPFTIGGGEVVLGFQEGAFLLREGEARTLPIPPEKAYGSSGQSPLAGRTLVFTIELVRVE